jgi:peptidoglycan-associated lipoprotein
VQANGEQRVQPNDTTTYTLTATGPGGEASATATVNVTAPAPAVVPPAPAAKRSLSDMLSGVQDCYFDFDKSDIRADCRDVLTRNADILKGVLTEFRDATIMLEGNCDERGSAEYNLALGDRRSTAVKDFLTQLGVSADRLKTISYGKERPVCTDKTEECYQKNRHVHFAPGQ